VLAFGLALAVSVIWAFIEYLPIIRKAPSADPAGVPVALPLYLYGDIHTKNSDHRQIIAPSKYLLQTLKTDMSPQPCWHSRLPCPPRDT